MDFEYDFLPAERVRTYHSIASSRPMPFVAEVLKICHFLSLSAGRPRALATSVGVIACSMSCLFANTTKMAFFSSSSWRKHSSHNSCSIKDNPLCRLFPWLIFTQSTSPYLQHGHQLGLWDAHPVAIAAVDNVYDGICVWVIAPPVGPVEQNHDVSWGQSYRNHLIKGTNHLLSHSLHIYMAQDHKQNKKQQWTNLILVCPPKSHTWNFRFLHVIVSTLKPIAVQKSNPWEQWTQGACLMGATLSLCEWENRLVAHLFYREP